MNREELNTYIDHCTLLGNIVTENSEIYNRDEMSSLPVKLQILLGSVCVEGLYVKKDTDGNIHLTHYDGDYTELHLGDCIDVIDDYAFYNNRTDANNLTKLHYVSGESVVSIGYKGFADSKVIEVDFPNVRAIGNGCFMFTQLGTATFNELERIPQATFRSTPLVSFRGDKVHAVDANAFAYCSGLQQVILPTLQVAEINSFIGCNSLSNIHIPNTCINYKYIVGTKKRGLFI
jgi:hypothetical protein